MYKCDKCKAVQAAGTKCTMVSVEVRDVTYPERRDPLDSRQLIDRGGSGFETVREEKRCPKCAEGVTADVTAHVTSNNEVKALEASLAALVNSGNPHNSNNTNEDT